MGPWRSRAICAALIVLFAAPASAAADQAGGAKLATQASRSQEPAPAKALVRLETTARALASLSGEEQPRIRDLYRRVIFLIEKGKPAGLPAITWFGPRRDLEAAYDGIRYFDDPRQVFLLIPGERPRRDVHRRPIRRGSFFVVIDRAGDLHCASPQRPDPRLC